MAGFFESDIIRVNTNIPASQSAFKLLDAQVGYVFVLLAGVIQGGNPGDTVTFLQSDGGSVTGDFTLGANGELLFPYNPYGWFVTTSPNNQLQLKTSSGSQVTGSLTFARKRIMG